MTTTIRSNRTSRPATLTGARSGAGVLLASDIVAIVIAVAAAHVVRFGHSAPGVTIGIADTTYLGFSILLAGLWLSVLALTGAYERRRIRIGDLEYGAALRATFALFGGVAIYSLVFDLQISRSYLLIALPLGLALLLLDRWIVRRVQQSARRRGHAKERVLLVGQDADVRAYIAEPAGKDDYGFDIVDTHTDSLGDPHERPEQIENLVRHAQRVGAQVVMVTDPRSATRATLQHLLWALDGTGMSVWLPTAVPELASSRARFLPVDGTPVVHVDSTLRHGALGILKRGFDIVVGSAALILSGPVQLVFAIAIKLDSPGPVLFRQTRVGRDGREFTILKLRSMRVDAEAELAELIEQNEGAGPLFKIRDDPRVTRIGRFIRATSIDELPQLVNVIRGDMSLVGPRPALPNEVELYDLTALRRLSVRPGLTGLWQVSGRSDLSWDEGLHLDLLYAENWSVLGDLNILLRTVGVVLRPKGAY